jgi:hypothetical protein
MGMISWALYNIWIEKFPEVVLSAFSSLFLHDFSYVLATLYLRSP